MKATLRRLGATILASLGLFAPTIDAGAVDDDAPAPGESSHPDLVDQPDSVEQVMREIVDSISPLLPLEVDEETTMTGVRFDEGGLRYEYVIHEESARSGSRPANFLEQRAQEVTFLSCRNTVVLTVLNRGYSVVFEYSMSDKVVWRIVLDGSACDAFELDDRAVSAG